MPSDAPIPDVGMAAVKDKDYYKRVVAGEMQKPVEIKGEEKEPAAESSWLPCAVCCGIILVVIVIAWLSGAFALAAALPAQG